jgi:predicted TPR repeat methyltransferase
MSNQATPEQPLEHKAASVQRPKPIWHKRIQQIDAQFKEVIMPDTDGDTPSQDTEWCEVIYKDGNKRRIRFHDYNELYEVPGLYEAVFYEHLRCCSPSRVIGLLQDVMHDHGDSPSSLRVLDIGAGNGMVGDELKIRGCDHLVGVDIIPEAADATHRDRPGLYKKYFVTDLTDPPEQVEEEMRRHELNCLCVVAALGFGDIPPMAFLKGLDLISTPGWMAFNIKETFLAEKDTSGFSALIRQLARDEVIQMQAYRRYRHRNSISGEPLHYLGVVARKLQDVPDEVMDFWKNRD